MLWCLLLGVVVGSRDVPVRLYSSCAVQLYHPGIGGTRVFFLGFFSVPVLFLIFPSFFLFFCVPTHHMITMYVRVRTTPYCYVHLWYHTTPYSSGSGRICMPQVASSTAAVQSAFHDEILATFFLLLL